MLGSNLKEWDLFSPPVPSLFPFASTGTLDDASKYVVHQFQVIYMMDSLLCLAFGWAVGLS
jgi:hypothetical protein